MLKRLRYYYNWYINKTIFPFFEFLSRKKIRKYSDLVTGIVLDIGCGDKPYKGLFRNAKKYIGTNSEDYYQGNLFFKPGPEDYIVNDGCNLPFSDNSFDSVLNFQVLPVFESPELFFKEVYRVLKPGGYFFLSTDFLYPLWNNPKNFFRATRYGLELLGKKNGFKVVSIEAYGGFWIMVARNFHKYLIRQLAKFVSSSKKEKHFIKKIIKQIRLIFWILLVPFIPLLVNLSYLIFYILDIIARDEEFTTNYFAVLIKE